MPPHPSPLLPPSKHKEELCPCSSKRYLQSHFAAFHYVIPVKKHIYVLQLLQILLQISWLSSHTKRPQEFGNFVSLSTVWQYITAPFFMKTYVRKMENTWGNCSLNLQGRFWRGVLLCTVIIPDAKCRSLKTIIKIIPFCFAFLFWVPIFVVNGGLQWERENEISRILPEKSFNKGCLVV